MSANEGWTIPSGVDKQTLVVDLQTGVFSLVPPSEEASVLLGSAPIPVTTDPPPSAGGCPEGTKLTGDVCLE